MASETQKEFLFQSEIKSNDFEHKRILSSNIEQNNIRSKETQKQFSNLPHARQLAKNLKWDAIEHLDKRLLEFEKNFCAQGGKVLWAETIEEAQNAILSLCKEHNCSTSTLGKSNIIHEINLEKVLQEQGIDTSCTAIDDYIQQLSKEQNSHIVHAAVHKSKEQIAKLFYQKLGTEANLNPAELTHIAQKRIQAQITKSDISFSSADFIIAESGSVCINENEGNNYAQNSTPMVQVVLAGIGSVISSLNELELMTALYSTYAYGQKQTTYQTIYNGPKKVNETEGPEYMYVILLDNGRTDFIAQAPLRESTYCIQCGSCANVCPVYRTIGGHTYDVPYPGPIGSITASRFKDFKKINHLSHASTLCGACTEVCPVQINLDDLLQYNRSLDKEYKNRDPLEKKYWKKWRSVMTKKSAWSIPLWENKNKLFESIYGDAWTSESAERKTKKTFQELYKKRK